MKKDHVKILVKIRWNEYILLHLNLVPTEIDTTQQEVQIESMRSSFAWPRRQITVPWGKLEAARIQQQMLCGLKNKAKLLKFISNDEIFYLCTSCIQHSTRAFYNDLELWNYLEIINTKRPKCCHIYYNNKNAQLTPKTCNFRYLLGIRA